MRSSIRIRAAAPADLHLLARWLPRGFKQPGDTRYLVAETDPGGDFLGGAYVLLSKGADRRQHAAFHLDFSQDEEFADLGSLLLRGCIVQARKQGAATLGYETMLPEDSVMSNFLVAQGFTAVQTLTDYEMDLPKLLEACNRVCTSLRHKDKLPPEARILPFGAASEQAALQLVRRQFGISLQLPAPGFLEDISTVVQFGPRIVGVILARTAGKSVYVPHTVVDEGFRQLWVTPTLWQRFSRKSFDEGYRIVRFATSEKYFRSMANFARRLRSKPLGKQISYRLALAPA